MRINARLDDSRAQKLEYLTRATDLAISEILKRAIDAYYAQMRESQPKPAEILGRSGFVGCGEADPELSERYKADLLELAAAKHDPR